MGARSFTELDCWRLANQLKVGIYDLIRRGPASRDLEFRNQIRNSAASAPRNMAEGFGRFQPKEFSQYLRVANGSLMETSNHLQYGVERGYFSQEEAARLVVITRRASAAAASLLRYLSTARPPNPGTEEPPKNRRTSRTSRNLRTGTQAPKHR